MWHVAEGYRRQTMRAEVGRLSGWHGGAGCARAADRPRRMRTVPSGGKRTGRRARDPDPGTGPAQSAVLLAALLPRRRTAHSAASPWTTRCALRMIAPDDVPVVVGGGDLDKAVPELGSANILFGLIAADITLKHDVAVVGRADHLPTVLGELVEQVSDLCEALRRLGDVLPEPSGIRALSAIGSIELVADRSEHVNEDVRRRRRHVREFSRAPRRSGSRRRSLWRSRRERRS